MPPRFPDLSLSFCLKYHNSNFGILQLLATVKKFSNQYFIDLSVENLSCLLSFFCLSKTVIGIKNFLVASD